MTLAASTLSDAELLRCYAEEQSEEAFAELVRRHLNVVHSAALRRVGSDEAADVAQAVFIELARHAADLSRHPALVGWLFKTTYRLSARHIRNESRRQRREWEAHAMQETNRTPEPEADWSRLAPVLDDAMHELAEADRTVLLLRHFEHRSFADVGARLGLSPNAARMRLERALDRLRSRLARRGIISTDSALALALSGPAVAAAPAGLAAKIAAGSLAAGVGQVSTVAFLSAMTSTQFKIGAVILGVGLLGSAVLVQQQRIQRLREDRDVLAATVARQSTTLRQLEELAAGQATDRATSLHAQEELLRLRGEVALLKSAERPPRAAQAAVDPRSSSISEEPPISDVGNTTPEDASRTFIWAVTAGQKDRFAELLKLPEKVPAADARRHSDRLFQQMTNRYGLWQFSSIRRTATNVDGTLKVYFGYRDQGAGNESELLVFLREFSSGWMVVIDDVPEENLSQVDDGPR